MAIKNSQKPIGTPKTTYCSDALWHRYCCTGSELNVKIAGIDYDEVQQNAHKANKDGIRKRI
ncbi:MAG: hypothetical protein DRQ51_05930 [Gammaproteobacteria bacterium]|nr:MAG: hypothetical protein DRQ51_05930 [Gammaproteobacteria bacterium]